MAKRTNEHAQTSKEEYEAIENRENEPQGSLPQASADVMKRRRILNVQKKGQSEPIVARKSTFPSPTSAPNPFASVSLAPPPTSQTLFSSFTMPSSISESDKTMNQPDRQKSLNEAFAKKMRERAMEGCYSGLLEDIHCYLGYDRVIQKKVTKGDEKKVEAQIPSSVQPQFAFSFGTQPETTNKPLVKSSTSVSFSFPSNLEKSESGKGVMATNPNPMFIPTPAKVSSTSESTRINTGVPFSFSTTTSEPLKNTSPAFKFSFPSNSNTLAQESKAPPVSTTPADQGNDDDQMPSEPKTEVEQVSDPNWSTVLEVTKAKFYRHTEQKWNPCASGLLRVEQHTTQKANRRVVIRDASTGKVHLNCSIPKGTPITPKVVKEKYYITFVSRRLEDEKDTMFMLQTHRTEHAALLRTMEEMSK